MKVNSTSQASLGQAFNRAADRMKKIAQKRKKGLKAFHPIAAAIKETEKLDPLLSPIKEDAAKIEQEGNAEAEKLRNIAAVRGEESRLGKRFLRNAEEIARRAAMEAKNVEESRSAWTKQYGA